MYAVRFAIAGLMSLALALSPVAADLAQAHVAKCEQMMGAQHDNCDCCGGEAACPPSTCVAQCSATLAVLTADTYHVAQPLERLHMKLATLLRSLALSPDPPPPRLIGA